MKKLLFCVMAVLVAVSASAYDLKRASVHDPSIVWDPASQTYYIFGSHRAAAKTTDLMSWTAFTAPWQAGTSSNATNANAFTTPQVTKIKKGGQEYTLNFDAFAWSAAYPEWRDGAGNPWNIDGNMWAPDVIWNSAMQKWCMYLSINGPNWNSSIILLTADKIEGPYSYQAPVVISGFYESSSTAINYKNTDLEIAIGAQESLPARYNHKTTDETGWFESWGDYMPHCIDPCVFYDEDGKLWMSYGSWSAGIWMLELDEQTGLRDYDVTYELKGSGKNITVDPYFGKRIAGGLYVSGEASYIEYIDGYYYLFVTYGGLVASGGYQMRVFRSENPDGPYVDTNDVDAIFTKQLSNFGSDAADNRGVNIFGAYTSWGNVAKGNNGERSQGHNSIIAAEDGRTYLVYHTRFQNRGEEHQVRVHQVFQNEDGWLVAAPFEYTGEQVKSADIAATQQIATDKIAGDYQLLIHPYKLNHTKKEAAKPVAVQLNADGTITGDKTGTWAVTEGTSYITLTIDKVEYKGVMVEQTMEPTDDKVAAFTALAKSGVTVWGYCTSPYTAIRSINRNADAADDAIYDLQGRRVSAPTRPGIYIRNGKKFIVK